MSSRTPARLSRRLAAGAVAVAVVGTGLGAVSSTSPVGAAVTVRNPLTGLYVAKTNTLVAVKVANTPPARPQSGLRSADQIWVEEQEGGWTRFIALYGAGYPAKVGPVRSGRETDLMALPQFGKPGLAYAGADAPVQALIASNPRVVDLGKDAQVNSTPIRPTSYFFDATRKTPYNFYVKANYLRYWGTLGGATKARSMGFAFGRPRVAGVKTTSLNVVWSKRSSMQAVWSKALGAWVMYADGKVLRDRETLKPLTAANVVVMRVGYSLSKVNSSTYPVPILKTVGRSSVTVLRQGYRWVGTWQRTSLTTGTYLKDKAGRPITLAPGQTWVMLVPVGRSLVAPYVQHTVTVR